MKFFILLLAITLTYSCKNGPEVYRVPLTILSDEAYPDNPDLDLNNPVRQTYKFDHVSFKPVNDSLFDIQISSDSRIDTISLSSIKLKEMIPLACSKVKGDDYLTHITLINQEWNRNQVSFDRSEFNINIVDSKDITRLDIARNCLNAYLWEVILFSDKAVSFKPVYHGWFNFPQKLYSELFEKYNHLSFEKYKTGLIDWVKPESKTIAFDKLRTVDNEKEVVLANHNNENYPLTGERKKKYKNIIYPKNTTRIQDFLTDSTRYATFSPPGYYNTKDPRVTQLSRLSHPVKAIIRWVSSQGQDSLLEIEIDYQDADKLKNTKLIISGINLKEIPTLDAGQADDGWKNSMGFGNHTFYETYKHSLSHSSETNPYFSVLTDDNDRWLDSHEIGIDGPLLHWDSQESGLLHIWILSFERHSFVGHYTVKINS